METTPPQAGSIPDAAAPPPPPVAVANEAGASGDVQTTICPPSVAAVGCPGEDYTITGSVDGCALTGAICPTRRPACGEAWSTYGVSRAARADGWLRAYGLSGDKPMLLRMPDDGPDPGGVYCAGAATSASTSSEIVMTEVSRMGACTQKGAGNATLTYGGTPQSRRISGNLVNDDLLGYSSLEEGNAGAVSFFLGSGGAVELEYDGRLGTTPIKVRNARLLSGSGKYMVACGGGGTVVRWTDSSGEGITASLAGLVNLGTCPRPGKGTLTMAPTFCR
jgi:hypothetical protein